MASVPGRGSGQLSLSEFGSPKQTPSRGSVCTRFPGERFQHVGGVGSQSGWRPLRLPGGSAPRGRVMPQAVRGGHRRENRGTDPATSIPGSGLFPPAPATCPVPCGQSPLLGSEKPSVGGGRCRRQAAGRVSGPCPHARCPPRAGCCSRPARGRGRERKPDPARPPRSALLGHGRVAHPAEPRLPCCNERRHASPADGACASQARQMTAGRHRVPFAATSLAAEPRFSAADLPPRSKVAPVGLAGQRRPPPAMLIGRAGGM